MKIINNKYALLLATSAISLALTGCGGGDGSDGHDGIDSGMAADVINVLNLDVTKVTYQNGMPTIEVFATNEADLPVVGLQDLGVLAAQLTPMGATGAGNSALWTRTARTSGSGNYIDNKNGSYTFTLELSEYNPELTQRYNVTAGGEGSTLADGVTSVPRSEMVKDFSGEGYEALYTKNIVSHAVCASCHAEGEPLTTRHSGYYTQETCATCHSSSMSTESQWNHLIHNIHNTAKTFEDKYEKEYTGEAAEALIQNNCKSCHIEPNANSGELTEWGNWTRVPTMETCSSCHVNIDFIAGEGHSQQNDNSNCIACHNARWTEELHTDGFAETKTLIDSYGMNTTLVVNEDMTATITISFVDADGGAVSASDLLPKIQRIEVITNVGPNNVKLGYYGKDNLLLVLNGELNAAATMTEASTISYTTKALTFGAIGEDADTAFTFTGLSLCSDSGEFVACNTVTVDGNLDEDGYLIDAYYTGMKAGLTFATLSSEAPSMRHVDSVNFTACAACHTAEFAVHKSNHHPGFVMSEQVSHANDANNEPIVGIDACVTCHTPDGTYASGANKGAIEMKLHSVHGSGDNAIITGMTCSQCHSDFNLDTFEMKGALATSFGQYSTPIAATCGSCHSESDLFEAHAVTQGAIINDTYEAANDAAQLESCFMCHNPSINDHTSVKM